MPSLNISDSSHPPTIGILTASLSGPTEINLWHGVADQARARQVNLICFSGGIPHWRQQYEDQKNILFNLPGPENVDGLLIWANILSHTLDRTSLEAFCLRYSPLPMISMGMRVPFIPTIRIDMQAGMRRLLAHLIEEHGRRRIAFIRGLEVSQDAEDRYLAYCETLEQFGLTRDPDLVLPGDFRRNSGAAAVQYLVEQKQKKFDALVSANDNMALGAMQALKSRGVRIPDDVIVAGFDDIEETQAVVPALTTIRAPWHQLGSTSLDMILKKLAGDSLPEQVLLQTELVIRQSCGCRPVVTQRQQIPLAGNVGSPPQTSRLPALEIHSTQAQAVDSLKDLIESKASMPGLRPGWPDELMDAFFKDIRSGKENPSLFLQELTGVLSTFSGGAEILEWQEVLDAFRLKVVSFFNAPEDILHAHQILENGYAVIGEMAHRSQLSQRLETENQTQRLNRIVQSMATTYDVDSLMKLLAFELPGLGIQSCFLSFYEDKDDKKAWSRLVLACAGKERMPLALGGVRFPSNQLAPAGMLPRDRNFAYDVEALYFQNEQIGFVLFEIGPRDGDVYTTLRGHLSSALKSAGLVQAALTAEAKAIKADQLKTHLLANVSHELRTPINIILGLSQIALSTPNPYGIDLPERLAKDLQNISESGEHLVRLINDLLDMSRAEIGELDLYFEPVSPRSLLKETFDTFKNISASKQKKVDLLLEVPEHLPVLQADAVRLRQILMNLMSNALKFTREGKIILGAEVQLPHIHVWISDTGSGILPELQERIFEPFVMAEPPGQRLGGIGLGLSITRRLVALHGGSITLDSQPGQGSTFHVYLPLPGINTAASREVDLQGALPVFLWISSQKTPPAAIQDLCQKNGLALQWLGHIYDLEQVLRQHRPAALGWDLEHARPGDWSMVQKLRSYPQYCQLPLLLFKEGGKKASGRGRLVDVLLKPMGRQSLQHILDMLPQTLQNGEIWVIDDDPQALKYYQEMIASALVEFHVRSINGGREALQLLDEATPDLVVLDLVMPEVDGFQVLEHLRSHTRTASIPVIILTGKMLCYEDVQRLDFPKVSLQTKGVLSGNESVTEVQRVLATSDSLPQTTSILVKQAMAYIQQNYPRAFSLKELSDSIGVSRSYLSRIFKIDTGISLWDYLNRLRIQKAKDLLLLGGQSITSIAAEVGYEDVGYFARVFREVTGCSPRAFKQKAHEIPGQ
jgi:signal transduction histidine kinase/DNA-binding LacI/PurR family transcriptional regulator/AraC-like DNA-binding protein